MGAAMCRLWELLEKWATTTTPGFILRLGGQWLARKLYSWWVVRQMTGVRLYSNREELERVHPWSRLMSEIKSMDACFVTGHNAIHADKHLSKVRRLMLPDPGSTSVQAHADILGDNSLGDLIRSRTMAAQSKGIPVRWLPDHIGYSFYVADRDELDPFVHIEFAMTGMGIKERPSITIQKKTHSEVYREFARIYDLLWSKYSRDPDNGTR